METEKSISVQQKQLAVERLSQNVTVQALANHNFKAASESLPTRIEKTFELPKIWEMKLATSETSVMALVEFELVKLAESINVSGNLTDGQISAIARGIVEDYPNETIADFKICFTKAVKGEYGKIWKLDGIEIGTWIKAYLERKYEVLEEGLKDDADAQKNKVFEGVRSGADWYQLWQEAIALDSKPVKTQSANLTMLNNLRGMTEKEIKDKGQEKPERNLYPITSRNELLQRERHFEWIKANFDARTGEKLPTWISEEDFNASN